MPAGISVGGVTIYRSQLAVGFGVLTRVGCRMGSGYDAVVGIMFRIVGVSSRANSALWGVIGILLPTLLCSSFLLAGRPSGRFA